MEKCGILLPIFSLDGEYGIGGLSDRARRFIDFLAEAGQDFWQILPVNPTGYGASPYQSPSAFAGNPNLIDPDALVEAGWLMPDETLAARAAAGRIDYDRVERNVSELLEKAFARFDGGEDYRRFASENAYWLDDYALFMALKEKFAFCSWRQWPEPYRDCASKQVAEFKATARRPDFYRFVQYAFFKQWARLHDYAREKGVEIIGDMPIYVAYDSADVWASPWLFELDERRDPVSVAGCPPDAFNADGQLWGNPLYNWSSMKEDGYGFWVRRMRHAMQMFDYVRIDHFRGFSGYYSVPAGLPDARVGQWRKGAGRELFEELERQPGELKIIAEDLGFLDDDVRNLVKQCGYPGMKVLQFGLYGDPSSEYLPKNYPVNCVAYTGTHDNDTAEGFYRLLKPSERRTARRVLKVCPFKNFTHAMIEAVMRSRAKFVVIPLADWLREDSRSRINTPGTVGGNNWRYRIAGLPTAKTVRRMARLSAKCKAAKDKE